MPREKTEILGRREQNKRETRRAIRAAALELAVAHGLEKLTVDAIAQVAGVSPRTFFNYFESKEDALVSQAAEGADRICQILVDRPADESPLEALRQAILASDYFGSDPDYRERLLARQRLTQEHPALMAHHLRKIADLERQFADALTQRLGVDPEQDLSAELLAAVAVSIIRVSIRRWVAQDDQLLRVFLDAAFQQMQHLDFQTTGTAPAH